MRDRWLLAWGLGTVASGGASLLVPLYLVELGGGPAALGLLAASAAAGAAPGSVVFGRLAERTVHRRTLLLVTLSVAALVLAVLPVVRTPTGVVLANAVLWLFVASVGPVTTVIVVADTPEGAWSERIGRLNTYHGVGWAVGLVLGAVWPLVGALVPAVDGTAALLRVLAVLAVAAAVLAARWLPRVTDDVGAGSLPTGRRGRRVARLLARSRRGLREVTVPLTPSRLYWTTRDLDRAAVGRTLRSPLGRYLIAAVLFSVGFAAFWAPLPVVLVDAGFGSGTVFGLYLVSSLASAALYGRVGRVATRRDPRYLQAGALGVRAVAFLAVAGAVGAGALALGATGVVLAVVGATWAVVAVVGTAIVTRLAPAGRRGEVLGVHTALTAVAGAVGGLLGGWAGTAGPLAAVGLAATLVVAGAGVVLTVARPTTAAGTPDETAGTDGGRTERDGPGGGL